MRDGFYAHGSTWGVVAVDSGQGSFILWAQQWNLSAIMGQWTMSIRWAAWLDFFKSSSWLISVYGGAFLKNYMNSIRSWKQLFFFASAVPRLEILGDGGACQDQRTMGFAHFSVQLGTWASHGCIAESAKHPYHSIIVANGTYFTLERTSRLSFFRMIANEPWESWWAMLMAVAAMKKKALKVVTHRLPIA